MPDLPTGTVTFLVTDIEGSTRLLQELGDRYALALAEHRQRLRDAFGRHRGVEVDTQGDAFLYAFASTKEAIAAAQAAQAALIDGPIQVRIGIHTGEPQPTDEGYVGIDVHRAARICSAAHGGQVVLSKQTLALLGGAPPVKDLGLHRLKDLQEPERLFQLGDFEFPPLRSLNATNLPTQATPLVGREREVEELRALVRDGGRLTTLTGAGGTGKTRLALQAAAELVEEFEDGVFWVPLSALTDPELVLPTVARTVGAKVDLTQHIDEKHMLLLLDNFEQILAAAPALGELLRGCPNLRLVVTSRAVLRISGEREYRVLPLSEQDALTLFCARAAEATPEPVVLEICRRLDGLPLAIELAAARTRVLSPRELLERLARRLPLLTVGPRDAPGRQQTLRATIQWSHELLSTEEQALFRRLAVFAGGCSLEAAEAVIEAELDSLQSLVENSMLRRDGERFTMLETIREYALERLGDSADADDVRRRHATYFLELAERGDLWDWPQPLVADRLQRDKDNFRTALTWLRATGDEEAELQLVAALGWFWIQGHLQEGRRWIDEAVPRAERHAPPLRVRLLTVAAAVLGRQGDLAQAASLEERCLALHREAGDLKRAALSLMYLGGLARQERRFARAKELLDEGRKLCEEAGDRRTFAGIGINLGLLAQDTGDLEDAKRLYEESLRLFEELQHGYGRRVALLNLSDVALEQNRLDEAESLVEESLRVVALRTWFPEPLEALAAVAARRGESARAARLLGAAGAAREQTGGALPPTGQRLHERAAREARTRLGDQRFEELLAEGATMTLDVAEAYALRTETDDDRRIAPSSAQKVRPA